MKQTAKLPHPSAEPLSLREALTTDRLEEFIAQEEARGVEACEVKELEETIELLAKSPQSEDQT